MFQRFFPNEYYDSTYHIDFHAFYDKGYRAVLFDVDNTLVEHDAPANARAKALIQKLKDMGYGVCFVSNNDEERVKSFNEQVGALMYIRQENRQPGDMCRQCRSLVLTGRIRCLSETRSLLISGVQTMRNFTAS